MTDENYWLRLALEGSQFTNKKLTARIAKLRAAGATLTKLPFDEAAHLRNVLRRARRQKTTIRRLHKENAQLRRAVKAARAGREAAEARLARLRTARKALSKKLSGVDADLRRVLRRSRRQKTAIKSLAGKNARLRRAIKGTQRRIEILEAQLDKLRAAGVRAVEKALRTQERAAGAAALGTRARSAARRARPRPHAAARARGAPRRDQPAAGCMRLRGLRATLCAERRGGIQPRRDRPSRPINA